MSSEWTRASLLVIVPEYELDEFLQAFDLKDIEEVTWEHVDWWLNWRLDNLFDLIHFTNGDLAYFFEFYGLEDIEGVREWHMCDWLCLSPEEVVLRGNQTQEWLAWLRATGQRDSDELLSATDLQAYE